MRWISFAQSDSLSRAVVHLLPASRGGIAAQPVLCSIELFGDRTESTKVSIDGIRLNQPDGIRLDEAFPRLKEGGNSLIGIAVDLEPTQQKGDLKNSVCMMEIFLRGQAVRFVMPLREEASRPRGTIPIISDRSTQTSLIFANQGTRFVEIQVRPDGGAENGNAPVSHPINISISPHSVSEFSLSSLVTSAREPFHCSWGDCALLSAEMLTELPAEVAGFIVFREAGSQRISAVIGL